VRGLEESWNAAGVWLYNTSDIREGICVFMWNSRTEMKGQKGEGRRVEEGKRNHRRSGAGRGDGVGEVCATKMKNVARARERERGRPE
jgi:hypothetical protein